MSIPKRYRKFKEDYPETAKAYEDLGNAVHNAGPLDEKTRALIKIAVSAGARLQGGLHSHVRKALKSGVTTDEINHAILLSLPTIGLPSMMAALSWAEDIFEENK
ncbi:MAG: carboxymuconolactone decarboxylase family protein [Ignavibacteria bacterium]|nr:carboxymuconolactone decarboxylase family protein [Ignavibacteria bacterium]